MNSGSNTVAVFDVKPNGSLTPVAASPFPSRGTNPAAPALRDDILVVVNKNDDPRQSANTHLPNYATLRVLASGRLILTDAPPLEVAYGSSPVDVTVLPWETPFGERHIAFGHEFLGGLLRSFSLAEDGRIGADRSLGLPDSEFEGVDTLHGPLGLYPHPYAPVVYVGFVTVNKLGVYTYGEKGQLRFVRSVPNSGQALCWIRTNRSGTRIYTSNTADNSISVYDSSNPWEPYEIQHLVLNAPAAGLYQIELDPTCKFLYVVGQRATEKEPAGEGNGLHVLAISRDGLLSEVSGSPLKFSLPLGTRPQGLAVWH